MERSLFLTPLKSALASPPTLYPRNSSRPFDADSHSCVSGLPNHPQRHEYHHLQAACLALHSADSYSCDERAWKAAVSAQGFVDSLHSIRSLFCLVKPRIQVCRCSAKHGSSLSESAPVNYFKESFDADDSHGTEDAMRNDGDDYADEQLSREGNGTMITSSEESRFNNERISYENSATEREDQNDSVKSYIAPANEGTSIPVKEPIYEVLEVKVDGSIVTKRVSRRLLLKTSGLRLRDIRSVDPSLWVTNSAPALLVRNHAVLLNLGSLRAIASADNVLVFDHKSVGAVAFLESLFQRSNPDPSVPAMSFELEVVEAALLSRTQRLERRLMEMEARVLSLLQVLPNRMTANVLEELRLSKQALVELNSKANALRQMLLELLESPQEIRRMTIIGRRCTINKKDGHVECLAFADKQLAEGDSKEEEEEMEMLLENYLQRCESCHGQAERLLDSAREMEDSIAVNLSSRRLEVGRLELLLQVGTFCSALGALVAGIFGMNLKSYLEENVIAFWLTSSGILLGGIVLFFLMYNHLKQKKIL